MKQKTKVIASIMCAMLSLSAMSTTALAAEVLEADNTVTPEIVMEDVNRLIWDTSLGSFSPMWTGHLVDLSKDSCKFSGNINDGKSAYTGDRYTGKYTYYVTIMNNGSSKGDVKYEIINGTSNDQVKYSGVVAPGKKVVVEAGGFATTSQMYVKFTAQNGACSVSGAIS